MILPSRRRRTTRSSRNTLSWWETVVRFTPVAALCLSGDLAIRIDREYGLDEVPRALAHVGEGRALGKVVIVPQQ